MRVRPMTTQMTIHPAMAPATRGVDVSLPAGLIDLSLDGAVAHCSLVVDDGKAAFPALA